MSRPVQVRVARRFSAAPERVFDAFLDPVLARRFLFATPTGEMVRAEIDPRVGGGFNFTDRRDGEDMVHTGDYLEIDRPRRLVFTLKIAQIAETVTRVFIDIAPVDGGSELTLTHEMAPGAGEFAERTLQGWGHILDAAADTIG